MSRVRDLIAAGTTLSFEFFPPRSDVAKKNLVATIDDLEGLGPTFVSVTYGAGGTTRELTRDVVVELCDERDYPAVPHLTCVGHTRSDIQELVADYVDHGVANVLALAGDPPEDGSPAVGDFTYALELVELVRDETDMSIGVAAHPEGHPRSPSIESDRRHLAEKLRVADFGITQFFFRADDYLSMVDDLAALDVHTPVLPGVIPVTNPVSVKRFADMNGAATPDDLWERLEATDDPAEQLDIAVDHTCGLAQELLDGGAPGVHFYTLNKPEATREVARRLGLGRPVA